MDFEKEKFSDVYCPVYRDLDLYSNMSGIKKIQRLDSKIKRIIMISLFNGDDLIPIVKRTCLEEGIRGAFISAIGAADRIPIASFNLETGKYDEIVKTGYHEIISANGNVSTVLDENNNAIDLIVHLHISFSDTRGNAYGGHLLTGFSSVAVGEVYIKEIDGGIYRYKNELEKKGYSTIRFSIPINKDLIPQCRENKDIFNNGKTIVTRNDVELLKRSGYSSLMVEKE